MAAVAVAGILVATIVAPAAQDSASEADERPRPAATRPGSVVVDATGELTRLAPPRAYRLTYRVQDWAGGRVLETTDTITVERPYRGLTEVRDQDAAAGDPARSRTVTDFGRISFEGRDAQALLVDNPPALAAGDLRFDAVLADAVAAGRLAAREQREVAGRRCRVYRSLEPVAAGTLTREPATATDYTDSCFGADGLLLEEVWVTDGRLLRRRLAVEVELEPAIRSGTFESFGRLLEPRQGGGSIRPVEPTSAPPGAMSWSGAVVPEGFTFRGRFAVVPPMREQGLDPSSELDPIEQPSNKRIGALADVWERGIDVLVVEQGGAADGTRVFELAPGEPTFDVPGLGTGQVALDGRLNEVRFPLPGGRYVRVLGTVPASVLRAVSESLRPAGEGTGLVYVDEAPG